MKAQYVIALITETRGQNLIYYWNDSFRRFVRSKAGATAFAGIRAARRAEGRARVAAIDSSHVSTVHSWHVQPQRV